MKEAIGAAEGRGQEVGLWTGGPVNDPTTFAPPLLSVSDSQQQVAVASPLSSEQQVRKMEYLENQAPMLQSRREELRRPQWMSEEEEKARKEEERKSTVRSR